MSRSISEALRNESERKKDLSIGIIKRYLGNGIWLYKNPGCNAYGRASAGQGSRSYAPGTSVNLAQIQGSSQKAIVSLPPPGRRGASAFPGLVLGGGELDALALRQAAPQAVPAGAIGYPVSLLGSGFLQSPVDSVRAVKFNIVTQEEDDDPFVTVTLVVWISLIQLDIVIDVSADAQIGYRIRFEISRS